MARFDANDSKKCKPMIQYARRDYVSINLLKSFVAGTVCYALLVALWVLYSMEKLLEQLSQLDYMALLIPIVGLYLAFMLIYLAVTYFVYEEKYTEGRRKVKKYFNNLKKVNQLYERERRLKMPASMPTGKEKS